MIQRWRKSSRVFMGVSVVAMLFAHPAWSASSLVLPRAGQVGVGLQGQYGSLLSSGGLGEEFGSGPGFAVRLRYRMRYERGIGLSFENHRLDARDPSGREGAFSALEDDTVTTRDRMNLVLAGFDFYQFFDTRERTVKHLSLGAGLAQVTARLSTNEIQYPIAGDGFYLTAGAGVERFFYRSWAWDLSTRYMAVFHDGKVNHDVQASAGIIFYAAY